MRNLVAAGVASALMAGTAFADGLAITVDGEAQGTIKIDLAERRRPRACGPLERAGHIGCL